MGQFVVKSVVGERTELNTCTELSLCHRISWATVGKLLIL